MKFIIIFLMIFSSQKSFSVGCNSPQDSARPLANINNDNLNAIINSTQKNYLLQYLELLGMCWEENTKGKIEGVRKFLGNTVDLASDVSKISSDFIKNPLVAILIYGKQAENMCDKFANDVATFCKSSYEAITNTTPDDISQIASAIGSMIIQIKNECLQDPKTTEQCMAKYCSSLGELQAEIGIDMLIDGGTGAVLQKLNPEKIKKIVRAIETTIKSKAGNFFGTNFIKSQDTKYYLNTEIPTQVAWKKTYKKTNEEDIHIQFEFVGNGTKHIAEGSATPKGITASFTNANGVNQMNKVTQNPLRAQLELQSIDAAMDKYIQEKVIKRGYKSIEAYVESFYVGDVLQTQTNNTVDGWEFAFKFDTKNGIPDRTKPIVHHAQKIDPQPQKPKP